MTKKVTEILDRDLAGRRLLSYGGTIRKARKKLLFSDEITESDDIMAVGDVQADEQGYIELYKWHFGEERYKRLSGEEKENMLKFVRRKGKDCGCHTEVGSGANRTPTQVQADIDAAFLLT